MSTDVSPERMRELARIGALAELDRIHAERDRILTVFPELHPHAAPAPATPAPKGKRRPLTPQERTRIARRMRRYWRRRHAEDARRAAA